ncbi:sensor histidine kinase [Bacteroides fragilis]|uniref:sensor histidine kinase n=1 Tax=Bacteroides fragilis TaxID=817 RepID=UPI0028119A3C|nr:HAMP domain-containing sensor histidine kinase [Bacteroides fragilis]WMI95512.1 HAMP domain-containing histidine kinase [Bacteroides fragilis]
MKRYSISVVLHILLLVVLSIGGYLLFHYELWFSTLIVTLLLIATGVHLYSIQMRLAGMMRRLTDSIRFNDMTQSFQPPFKSRMMIELADELSQTLKLFRGRLLEEEVKHQYYENLLSKVDTAVMVTDRSGRVEWMNHAAVALVGQETQLPQEWLTASWNETQVVRIRQQGTSVEMAVSCTLFAAQNKERLLVSLKNIHSVLERNEMEAWQKLIRVLTHEIMNSITPIISLSETLSERGIPERLSEKEYGVMLQAMQTIHRRSKGLLGFVENYRRLTRIPTPVCALVIVDELFSDLRKLFPDAFIHFAATHRGATLYIDRAQIEQVLINLIKNAKEACVQSTAPQIEVELEQIPGKVCGLTVRDNGEGILPEVMDKIFVPFFTTKPSGSGIGLSLCKQIMNLHGGTITVSSEISKGSCFTLMFPGR